MRTPTRRFLSLLLGLSHLFSSVQAAPPEWLLDGIPESERAAAKVSLDLDTVTELDFGFRFLLKYRQAPPETYSEANMPPPAPTIPENFWETLKTLKNLRNLSLEYIGEFLDLKELRHFPNLTTLKLGWTFLSDPKSAAHLASLQPLVNLVYLNLSSNHIGERGFAQLMALTFPKLEHLILSGNQLNGDIDLLLWRLLSKSPKLWELDISLNNLGLEGAKAVASFTQLKTLWIGHCGLKDKSFQALTSLKHLTHLSVYRNSLTSKSANHVAAFKDLEVLDISHNALGTAWLKAIGSLLQLRDLNLSNTQLKERNVPSLLPLKRLTVLDLSSNDLGWGGMSFVSLLVSLETLNVENTGIDEADLPVLRPLTKLKELNISQKGVQLQVKTTEELLAYPRNFQVLLGTPEVWLRVGKKFEQENKWEEALEFYNQAALQNNPEAQTKLLQTVDHLLQGLTEEPKNKVLALFKPENRDVKELNLYGHKIDDVGAQALAVVLSKTQLTMLNLRWNQIGDEGARALVGNTTLTTLYLDYNQIGDEGARALVGNTTLTTLYLDYNQIGDEGACALAANSTLTTLHLWDNQIGDEGARALAANSTLTTLNLWDNQIGVEGARALAANTTLTTLDLGLNQIGDAEAKALGKMKQLKMLRLYGNHISQETEAFLKKQLPQTDIRF